MNQICQDLLDFKHVIAVFSLVIVAYWVSQKSLDSNLLAVLGQCPLVNTSLSDFKIVLDAQNSGGSLKLVNVLFSMKIWAQ